MGFTFVVGTAFCVAFAYFVYGGPVLEAVAHFQEDLMSLILIVSVIGIPVCVIAKLCGSKQKAVDKFPVQETRGSDLPENGMSNNDTALADKYLRDAGYDPDLIRGRISKENASS